MKWLLHSKRFRKNLCKWLFMYIGVMCSITSVITYSRYITNMQFGDKARPAKFDVSVDYLNVCAGYNCSNYCDGKKATEKCELPVFRPTVKDISFYFKVDTNDLEVKTDLFLYLIIEKQLIEKGATPQLFEISNDGKKEVQTIITITAPDSIQKETGYVRYRISEVVDTSNRKEKTYLLKLVNTNSIALNSGLYLTEPEFDNAFRVEYSAIQIK